MRLDLTEKPDLRWLSELISDVRHASRRTAFIVAGAAARDIILMHAHGIDTGRATLDVDLAFAVESWKGYMELRSALLQSGRFTELPRDPHAVRHLGAGNSTVDIIPFAGVEDENRTIAWPPDGSHIMNMIGFREAAACAVEVSLPGGAVASVVSLPAMALLKLAAWKDRRLTYPRKDAQDFRLLLRTYLDAGNSERLYSEGGELLARTDFDYESASAWLLGLHARAVLMDSESGEQAHRYFQDMLIAEVAAIEESDLVSDMASRDPAYDMKLLAHFAAGFAGKSDVPRV